MIIQFHVKEHTLNDVSSHETTPLSAKYDGRQLSSGSASLQA